MKYLEILKKNKILQKKLKGQSAYKILVLSNITVNQIKEVIEFQLRDQGVNAHVAFGSYDNIVKDSIDNQNDSVIIFWELDNLVDELGYKIDSFHESQIEKLERQIKSSIEFSLNNLITVPVVFFNLFDTLFCEKSYEKNNALTDLSIRLNNFLKTKSQDNLTLINLKSIKSISSYEKSIDYRFYNTSKAPYTIVFFINYAKYIAPVILSLNGKAKKALIFDCDNTLWKGVVGEDGINNIKMSNDGEGRFYREVQYLSKSLAKNGVIIGLCSKNNFNDVESVIETHKDMVLDNSDLAIKKINWKDKVENIIDISNELNIGLDSIVFVDDSSFEISNVFKRLPKVTVFQVPDKIHQYPVLFRELMSLFYSHSKTNEDTNKNSLYLVEKTRKKTKEKYKDMTMYLKSLNLTLTVYIDLISQATRASQLTQKTNQFNLSTIRYSEKEIKIFMQSSNYRVYTFNLEDDFGSYGLTGLCIVKLLDGIAYIDLFLMSCRVIGRNVEFNFINFIINNLLDNGVIDIFSIYKKTEKNSQVANFWESVGFVFNGLNDRNFLTYKLSIKNYNNKCLDYIKVKNEE